MDNLTDITTRFENTFRVEIAKIEQVAPKRLYQPIGYSLSMGGKRLRPALLLYAASLYTTPDDRIQNTAMAIEIFHNFTLLHDDIMDNADVRRGHSTVHRKYGENVAILSGDAMSILAFQYFAKGDPSKQEELLPLFSTTALEVCEGQQLDMDFETSESVSVEEYIEMIRLKTAVLIAASLKIGAISGNAPKKEADLLYEYGINIGIAFQLQDDWLDVYGDPDIFGKKSGGDICANKKTFLLLKAIEKSDQQTLHQLNQWLSKTTFDPKEKIAEITAIYTKTGVDKSTREKMKLYHDKAIDALEKINITKEKKETLIQLASAVMNRIK